MSGIAQRPGALFAGTAIACLAAVVAALISQHAYGMEPCPWCILQRIVFLAIALACVIGLSWRAAAGRVAAALLMLALSVCGVAAALWQHFVAASSTSCNLTFADKVIGILQLDSAWPDVFSPRASCADAAVKLLGVPYEFWSLALFVLTGLAACWVLRLFSRQARNTRVYAHH